jgi:hypothetical protein
MGTGRLSSIKLTCFLHVSWCLRLFTHDSAVNLRKKKAFLETDVGWKNEFSKPHNRKSWNIRTCSEFKPPKFQSPVPCLLATLQLLLINAKRSKHKFSNQMMKRRLSFQNLISKINEAIRRCLEFVCVENFQVCYDVRVRLCGSFKLFENASVANRCRRGGCTLKIVPLERRS